VMAHLCEMYRRSIPPDIPLSGLASGRHRREADLPDAPEVSS
jgi:circadian clock protein KaiA